MVPNKDSWSASALPFKKVNCRTRKGILVFQEFCPDHGPLCIAGVRDVLWVSAHLSQGCRVSGDRSGRSRSRSSLGLLLTLTVCRSWSSWNLNYQKDSNRSHGTGRCRGEKIDVFDLWSLSEYIHFTSNVSILSGVLRGISKVTFWILIQQQQLSVNLSQSILHTIRCITLHAAANSDYFIHEPGLSSALSYFLVLTPHFQVGVT